MILQIIIIIFAVFAISRSYLRLKNRNENTAEFIFWTMLWVLIVVVALIPEISAYPAKIFGIGRGIDFFVYSSIVALFYLVYRIYSKIEVIEQDITKIVREIAIMNNKGSKKKKQKKRSR